MIKKIALTLPGMKPISDPDNFRFSGQGIGGVFSALLPYVFVLSGLALLLYLIMGGFEMLTSAGDPERVKKAQGKVTHAVIGFVLIFLSYWLVQLFEAILGIEILGS